MIFISSTKSNAQQTTWEGTEFVFTQPNTRYVLINLRICSKEVIEGTITFQDTTIYFNNNLDLCTSINFERAWFDSLLKKGNNQNQAIRVSTTKPSTCYVTIFNTAEDEGFCLLPTNFLDTVYNDIDFDDIFRDTATNHIIVPTDDNTIVDIFTKINGTSHYNLNKKNVLVLNRFPAFTLHATKPVSVFVSAKTSVKGSNCTGCCSEELYEQVLPNRLLGKTYLISKIHGNNESIILINAISDNTCLEIDGENFILQKDENYRYYITQNSIIRSSTNIMVFRIFESSACMNDAMGDPELFQLHPIENLTNYATFYPPNGYFQKRYINILIPKESLDSIYLDGVDIKNKFEEFNKFYYTAEFEITQETHTLKAKNGFQAFSYGISNSSAGPNSAGYFIHGTSIYSPYQFKTNKSYTEVDLCDDEIYKYISFDTSSTFIWNDGDLSSQKTIVDSGIYKVQVNNDCLNYNYTDTIKVNKLNCLCTPKVPDVFSPNNDGRNDNLVIEFNCSTSSYFKLKIFNRWGVLIYDDDNYKNNWDGKDSANSECTDGAYIYFISYEDENHTTKTSTGIFSLLK